MTPDRGRAGVEAETLSRLQAIIRFDTTNPPGNELPLARYLESALRDEGIETNLLEPTENRAQVIGRIRGNGALRPVIALHGKGSSAATVTRRATADHGERRKKAAFRSK